MKNKLLVVALLGFLGLLNFHFTASAQPSYQVTTTADAGAGSLRNGINTAPGGSYIFFAPNLSGQTITLTSGQLVVTNNLTIEASALTGGVIVSANSSSHILVISNTATLHLHSLTLINGRSDAGVNGYNGNASNGGDGGNGGLGTLLNGAYGAGGTGGGIVIAGSCTMCNTLVALNSAAAEIVLGGVARQ
jgi:hypothetical protein